MSTDTRDERLVRRIAELSATDPQFAAAMPSEAVTAAVDEPGLRLPQIVQTVLQGYSDRPALGERAVDFVTDPATGRTTAQLLPRFNTITYGQLWDRVRALAATLHQSGVAAGDRVAILGFTSADYTTIDTALGQIGAVSVPLQISSTAAALAPIVLETEPSVIAASADHLSDAVELALTAHAPTQLIVFDHHPEIDDHHDALAAARIRLDAAGRAIPVVTLADLVERGRNLPQAPAPQADEADPLALLIYTSGSTGAPKGAMYRQGAVAKFWRRNSKAWLAPTTASINLSFMPMSHVMGRGILYASLAAGGTAYFAARSDLSTLLEDLALVRPTELNFVPRVWEMIYGEFGSQVDRRVAGGAADRAAVEAAVIDEMRQNLLGGRYISAMTGSAPISAELKAWVEQSLDVHLLEGYGSTEAGMVFFDDQVQRPPVIDYKLVDVPDLGYFRTDKPHPRGELLVKTENLFPGYYRRPEVTAEVFDADGYYKTGDIVAEIGPDQLQYVDRRNNVLKLAQGEFVTVAKLEAVFGNSPLVRQIYLYGNSARPYLLAVVVPTDPAASKQAIAESLQEVAKAADLQSYEIPRDFLIETTPFTVENGLLTGIRKLAWPKLKAHYGDRLEQLYTELADVQAGELRALRAGGADAPVLETVSRAAGALLGASAGDVQPDAHFTGLGGDSLSALTFGNLLQEIFDVEVPVSVIVSPANDLVAIAAHIESARQGSKRPTFASVHGRHAAVPDGRPAAVPDGRPAAVPDGRPAAVPDGRPAAVPDGRPAAEVHASDLTLDKFIDAATLAAAPSLPKAGAEVRTVLLTGATGFLGRYLALEWLERMDLVDGTVIALVRARSDDDARARLDAIFDSGDAKLRAHYQELAADHLEVIAGDKGESDLGLDHETWQRLADTVDLIVDPAALVNHVLPYRELFGPNALGTAELIRIALTTKIKPYTYVSTIGVGDQLAPGVFVEDADIREISETRRIDDSYANGYGNSKWAGEVLLREANDLCGLPVAVFRCDMILADTTYSGQLNLPDMFTRMMLSLVATGIAPGSFYELDADGNRQRAHYDGLPVEFIAEAISTLGAQSVESFATYHVMNPYDDGIGMDQFVDWLVEAGYPIERIADYHDWLSRFETALRALPDKQRQASLLPLLHNYQQPGIPLNGAMAPTDVFRTAVQEAKIGPDKDIPHVSREVIVQYVTNLERLGLL